MYRNFIFTTDSNEAYKYIAKLLIYMKIKMIDKFASKMNRNCFFVLYTEHFIEIFFAVYSKLHILMIYLFIY